MCVSSSSIAFGLFEFEFVALSLALSVSEKTRVLKLGPHFWQPVVQLEWSDFYPLIWGQQLLQRLHRRAGDGRPEGESGPSGPSKQWAVGRDRLRGRRSNGKWTQ